LNIPESLEAKFSFNSSVFKTVEAMFSHFDPSRSVLLVFGRKTAAQARSAKTLRVAFEWMSCVRVLCAMKFAVLEFLDNGWDGRTVDLSNTRAGGKDSKADSIINVMAALNLKSKEDKAADQQQEASRSSAAQNTNLTPSAELNYTSVEEALKPDAVRNMEQNLHTFDIETMNTLPTFIYTKTEDFKPSKSDETGKKKNKKLIKVHKSYYEVEMESIHATKFMQTLTCGRPWAFWMPTVTTSSTAQVGEGAYLSINSGEEGLEVGPIQLPFMVDWKKPEMMGGLSCRPYWRSPISGLATIRKVIEVEVHTELQPNKSEKIMNRTERIASMSKGPGMFAAASSFMVLSNATTESVAFSGATLIPGNKAVWTLRIMAFHRGTFDIFLEKPGV
jgi:hypothetical protein